MALFSAINIFYIFKFVSDSSLTEVQKMPFPFPTSTLLPLIYARKRKEPVMGTIDI